MQLPTVSWMLPSELRGFFLKQEKEAAMPNPNQKIAYCEPEGKRTDPQRWDTEIKGLGQRQRGTCETCFVQWKHNGHTRKKTLGRVEELPVVAARQLARELLEIEKRTPSPSHPPSFAVFARRYLEHASVSWKEGTARTNRLAMQLHIAPYFETFPLRAITSKDVLNWRDAQTVAPGTVNRYLAVLSGMMRYAETCGYRTAGTNPCKNLRLGKSDFRAIYLNAAQWGQIGTCLQRHVDVYPMQVALIRFLALTGARVAEAKLLTWDAIHGDRAALPDAKTGPRAIWFGPPVMRLLSSLPTTNFYVFGERDAPISQHQLNKLWDQIRNETRLPKLRMHDMRQSFASVAIQERHDLRVVAGLLAHADLETTEGYVHLCSKTVEDATERVGRALQKAMNPKQKRRKSRTIFDEFRTSPLTINQFCAPRGLDEDEFRIGLIAWRKQQQCGGGRS